ncbi:hypothetical protein BJ138DRAFT_1230400, partial [Hygrophoropsis aurantiaca]
MALRLGSNDKWNTERCESSTQLKTPKQNPSTMPRIPPHANNATQCTHRPTPRRRRKRRTCSHITKTIKQTMFPAARRVLLPHLPPRALFTGVHSSPSCSSCSASSPRSCVWITSRSYVLILLTEIPILVPLVGACMLLGLMRIYEHAELGLGLVVLRLGLVVLRLGLMVLRLGLIQGLRVRLWLGLIRGPGVRLGLGH